MNKKYMPIKPFTRLSVIFFCILLVCCKNLSISKPDPLFRLLSKEKTGIYFNNSVKETKDFNILTYRNFYNGGGVAVGDINNDGLPDLYFTANQLSNKLYLNKGNFGFEDITEKAGVAGTKAWSTGVSMADINADGWLDIYVCNSGDVAGENKENELFINNKDGTFSEQAKAYNLNNEGYTTHAAFFDYDLDGDLDCYILNNSFKESGKIELYRSMRDKPDLLGGDRLMRNDGDTFTDVSATAGIYSSEIGFGLGVATADLNGDLYPDLYVSNDFWERDYLYINNGNGTFTEDLPNRMDYSPVSSMGADIADINADGSPEIFATDMLPASNYRIKTMTTFEPYHLEDLKYRANYHYQFIQNCLQLNDGQGNFQEIAQLSGVSATDWSWGALFFDFENDGKKDLFVANGIYKDITSGDFRDYMDQPEISSKIRSKEIEKDFTQLTAHIPSTPVKNYAFVQTKNLRFENKAEQYGLGQVSFSNGSVYADLDNDGDQDLVVNNVNMDAFVYENTSEKTENNYLKIGFKGSAQNPFGIGTKVIVEAGGQKQVLENFINRGFQSSIEPLLLFGLGKNTDIDKLTVIWPDGKFQEMNAIKANRHLMLAYSSATGYYKPQNSPKPTWFKNTRPSAISAEALHTENPYNDFNQEILLLQMLSTEGPRLAFGDVDGDGLEDLFMAGAKNDPDKLFIQQPGGKFQFKAVKAFEIDKAFESTCASFLDHDSDGDQDLLVGAGGNEPHSPDIQFIVRLYENNGHGDFQVRPDKIPPCVGNFSTLEVNDFDHDGDPDFFLGARVKPGTYGVQPNSYLFKNEGGEWTNVTPESMSKMGMVTDAAWADIDKDNDADLIVVGDWMPVYIFRNEKGVLEDYQSLDKSTGWWQRIEPTDLDNDGDMDFILGNWGLNTKLQSSAAKPLALHVGDFDDNGMTEFILDWKAPDDEILSSFAPKNELTAQIPHLKSQNLLFKQFAQMGFEEFAKRSVKKEFLHLKTENLESAIAWNENGSFRLEALPLEAQVSPVFGIVAQDFNADGQKDIWLGGNFFGLKPQMGRHNASHGILLKGLTNKTFEFVSNAESGISIDGQIRDAHWIRKKLIVSRNNDSVQVFELNKK